MVHRTVPAAGHCQALTTDVFMSAEGPAVESAAYKSSLTRRALTLLLVLQDPCQTISPYGG
jgi:hypothetical protein